MRFVLGIAIIALLCGCTSLPQKKVFTSIDFDNLRFLEGRWIGHAPDGSPFYEEYTFVGEREMRSERHSDASYSNSTDGSTVVLEAGQVTSTWNEFTWMALEIVPGKACFVPIKAPSSFCWERKSDTQVHVTQRWADESGNPQEYVVALQRPPLSRHSDSQSDGSDGDVAKQDLIPAHSVTPARSDPGERSEHSAIAADSAAPTVEEFTSHGASIGARIFYPANNAGKARSAVVLFHGGGWNEGDASWMDAIAEQYSQLGMVAVSVGYRLSRDGVTPFDAVADARNAIRWVRRESNRLRVDPNKVAALGTSAGGHLAASTAIFDEPSGSDISSVPNALVLRSPAVSVATSTWFQKLSGGKAQAAALSPDLHVRPGLPPMILLQGELDNVTPAAGARAFCQRMEARGNTCRLELYPSVGHLFTRNLASQEVPDYAAIDREVTKQANEAAIAFLREHGLVADASTPSR